MVNIIVEALIDRFLERLAKLIKSSIHVDIDIEPKDDDVVIEIRIRKP